MRFTYDKRLCRMATDAERRRFGDLRGMSDGRRTKSSMNPRRKDTGDDKHR